MIPGFKQPRLSETRIRLRRHRPDAYELVFRRFIAALKEHDEPRALKLRDELRRLARDEDRQ